jgi:integrase/recombinase XerD
MWAAKRIGVVRVFARHLATIDPNAELLPADLLPARSRRVTHYLYSDADIAALMAAARALPNPLKAATFEALIGLLATTGLRGGEAMRLDRGDVDWIESRLTVRDTKFGKSRQIPLHTTTLEALRHYRPRARPSLPDASHQKCVHFDIRGASVPRHHAADFPRAPSSCRGRPHPTAAAPAYS